MGRIAGFGVLTRRRLLKVSLGAGVLLATAAGGLVAMRGRAPKVQGLRCLGDHEYRTLTSLALALLPPGGPFPFGADRVDLARAFDGFLADEPEDERKDLQKALLLLEYGPVVYERRAHTFSNLDEGERLAHFERWATSDDVVRRQVAVALRKFLSLVF